MLLFCSHCPSVELLESAFDLTMSYDVKQVEISSSNSVYNMEAFDQLAANPPAPKTVVKDGKWFCHNECQEYPEAFMTIKATDSNVTIPIANEEPVGRGKWPNPVQACLFGASGAHCHAVAIQFLKAGYHIQSLNVTFSTSVSKRKAMGVDGKDTKAFPDGGTMTVKLESNAPDAKALELLKKCETTSLGYMGVTNPIPLRLNPQKK
jgi:uncharacterized OsmC-like protein